MDTAISDIQAIEFTPSSAGDSLILPELLGQIPDDEQIGSVIADGAYDTFPSRDFASQNPVGNGCHAAITDQQAIPIIPVRKNGRTWKEDCPATKARTETLRATRYYGRTFWKHWTGYQVRSRVGANPLMVCKQTTAGQRMRCLKAFGERIAARDPNRQTAEIHNRIALMDRLNALGTAEIVRVA